MKFKFRYLILILLFISYLGIRLFFAVQTDYFSDDYSYYVLRQVDNIVETGKPLIQDPLSFGGRTTIILPFYYYFLALFRVFFKSILVMKIVNNILASLLVLGVYLLSSHILKNRRISLLCSIIAASYPAYINETINKLNPISIMLPGSFFLYYLFLNIENKKTLHYIIPAIIILTLCSSNSLLLLIGIIFYIFLNYIENKPIPKIELEITSFFLLFSLWVYLILYKNAFQLHGFSIIWKNAPVQLIANYFKDLNVLSIITNIGLLPLIFGTYTAYKYLFIKKSKSITLFIGLYISIVLLSWFKLIPLKIGLMYIGTSLVILFGQFLKDAFLVLKKSKFANMINPILIGIFLLLTLIQILPGFYLMDENIKNSQKQDYIDGFIWLKNKNLSTVLGLPEEGHLINYFGFQKNIIDTNFILIKDINLRYDEIISFYKNHFKTNAFRILKKYDVDYFIISSKLENYKIDNVVFTQDECFDLVYNKSIKIYKVNCLNEK